jgi:RHS repeat-associated protein
MTVGSIGNVVGYDDFYPYGMTMSDRSSIGSADARYKFTGKEREYGETGWDYFGARYGVYPAESGNSRIGRWLQVDPSADKYGNFSPFVYSFNNPMKYIDPDGNDPTGVTEVAVASAAVAVGVGIAITATYLATKNYLEHPNTINFPNQTNVTNIAIALGLGIYQTVSNWFSSGEKLQQSDDGSTQAKAAGQTYDGRPIDKNGNVLGGSGEPRINVKKHSSEKKAKDAARNEGKSKPVKPTSPAKGNRHYHPTDETGKKISGSTHHEY